MYTAKIAFCNMLKSNVCAIITICIAGAINYGYQIQHRMD